MKTIISIFIFTFITFVLSGCNILNNSSTNNSNSNLKNTSQENNNNEISRTSTTKTKTNTTNNFIKLPKETELSSFSTPLKSGVAARITNIKITSNKINGHILKNGDTFSFNEIIGPCTAEEGYKEAEIFVNKQIKYALGGRKLPS